VSFVVAGVFGKPDLENKYHAFYMYSTRVQLHIAVMDWEVLDLSAISEADCFY
jgi:hypothetical protein